MKSQPLIDFERRMYCERDEPDCGACSLVRGGLDCAGVRVPSSPGQEIDIDAIEEHHQQQNRA